MKSLLPNIMTRKLMGFFLNIIDDAFLAKNYKYGPKFVNIILSN